MVLGYWWLVCSVSPCSARKLRTLAYHLRSSDCCSSVPTRTRSTLTWPPAGSTLTTSSSVSFASADVTMTEGGNPVSLSVVSRTNNGYGDNTIVWEPSDLSFFAGMEDRRFTVTVSNISGPQTTVTYDVVVMDPAIVTDLIFSNGFESGSTGSWSATVP